MKLVVVRHGETLSNLTGQVTGRSEDSLTENGILQMNKVREGLVNSHCKCKSCKCKDCKSGECECKTCKCKKDFSRRFIDVYASPMKRCVESVQIVAPEYTPIYDDRLVERDLGELQDYTIDQLWEKPLWNSLETTRMPEGAETLLSGLNRVREFLDEMREKYSGKCGKDCKCDDCKCENCKCGNCECDDCGCDDEILIVTHSFVSRCLWILTAGISDEKEMASFVHKNDEIKIYEM